MTAHVGVGSAWKAIATVSVGVGGAWKTVTKGWVGVGGVWKVFYEAITIALPASLFAQDVQAAPTSANATMTFNSDGTYTGTNLVGGNWATPGSVGVGAGYDIRWVTGTGSLSTGTANTWQSLSSARTYGRSRPTAGINTATGTIQIRDAVSLSVLTTSAGTLEAEVI